MLPLVRRAVVLVLATLTAGFFAWPSSPEPDLTGLWARTDLAEPGVRFYYFHPDGKGLYRYGRMALNTTESYDWEVDDDRLELRFRKSGRTHAVPFTVDDGWLTLLEDPREPKSTRYRRVRGPIDHSSEGLGRMWTDVEQYATGGYGFRIYQLHDAKADGTGVGWFHEGDFDDWSTESLRYELAGDRITFHFIERDESHTTEMIRTTQDGRRALTFVEDPRDFWHRRTYADGGKSFDVVRATTR